MSRIKIKRRYPAYFTDFDETENYVKNNKELMEVDWVKDFCNFKGNLGLSYTKRNDPNLPELLHHSWRNNDGIVRTYVIAYIYGSGAKLGLNQYKE